MTPESTKQPKSNPISIEEARYRVAKSKGYPSWGDMYDWVAREGERPDVVAQLIEAATDEAYNLYFSSIYQSRFTVVFKDFGEYARIITEDACWMASIDGILPVTAPSKEKAFEELMISLKVKIAYDSGYQLPPKQADIIEKWIKASDKIPFHLAFWNIPDGFKKDCQFPVRVKGKYYMADLFDQRLKDDPENKISFFFNNKHHFADQFHEIEWLDAGNDQGKESPADFWVQCNVCKQQLKNWIGSTPCCGSIAYLIEEGQVTNKISLFASINGGEIKPTLVEPGKPIDDTSKIE